MTARSASDVMSLAALAYTGRLGWAVFPLRGKMPAIRAGEPGGRGHLDATTEPAAIEDYWRRCPGANVGVSCIGSGLLALDIDPRHGGDATLAEIEERFGPLPHTIRQNTGGGGQHILFRENRDVPLRGSLGCGIDIRYRGGIVVAPSGHPETGRQYAWAPGHHPLQTPMAEPPEWLLDLLLRDVAAAPSGRVRPPIEEGEGWGPKPRYSRTALQRACAAIERAPAGQQNLTLNAEAFGIGQLVGAGLMPRQLAIDCLIYSGTAMGNEPGRRPWIAREIQQKVTRAVREGEMQPREVAA